MQVCARQAAELFQDGASAQQRGGHVLSYRNNQLSGNVSDGAPTGVLAVK